MRALGEEGKSKIKMCEGVDEKKENYAGRDLRKKGEGSATDRQADSIEQVISMHHQVQY